jgi:glycosyltransferase involved in cell wall biosynthesis
VRILWLSNSPDAPSGYGEQTGLFGPRLAALGHDVAFVSNWGHQGAVREWNGFRIYPGDGGWGNRVIGTYAEHWKADLVIALCDAWVMHPDQWPDDLRMAIWAPIDHAPIPPAVIATLNHDKVQPIAMSRDGEEWMNRFSLGPLYVPHGIDTALFCPRPEIREQNRDWLKIPRDAFLVGMVAANKGSPQFPRKGFPQAFDAFARFAKTHDDAYFYVHTDADGNMPASGINLGTLAKCVGIPEDRVIFPPPSAWHLTIPRELVANLYPTFDVLLNPSWGEGFGIPIMEAQASGCPVIASAHSAMTELVKDTGWLVGGDRYWDAMQESFAIIPSIDSIQEALGEAYRARIDPSGWQQRQQACVEFAQSYDADTVTLDYWQPALEALGKPREVPPLNGKARKKERKRAAAERRRVAA